MATKKATTKKKNPVPKQLVGKGFKKGKSGNPSGGQRIPPEIKKLQKQLKHHLTKVTCECLTSTEKLREYAKNSECPLETILAREVSLIRTEKSHSIDRLERLITRAIGKPTEVVEMDLDADIKTNAIPASDLSDRELKSLHSILKKRGNES